MNEPMTPRDEMMEMVALYAMGVLPREEAAIVAGFIANDDDARREYQRMRATVDTVALSAEEPVDSARSSRMKERLLARVRTDARGDVVARRRIGPNPGWLWGTGLAAAAALILSLVTVAQDVALRGDLAQAQRRANTLAAQLTQAERIARADRQTLTDLVSSDARRFTVAQGTVVVRGDHVYFALSKLPALPKGKVYQAWTLPKGGKTMQPSVTFTPNADGVAVVALPVDAAKVGTVAMSVEPEGGSKAPTTKPNFICSWA